MSNPVPPRPSAGEDTALETPGGRRSDSHPSGLLVVLRHWVVEGQLNDELFDLMERAYAHHKTSTPFRYVYTADEWAELMRNDRIVKIIATLDGRTAGLITGSEDLDAVPWISPDFYRARHPGRRIFYQQDTFVDPDVRNPRVLRALFEEGIRFSVERDAIVAFDVSHELVGRRYVELIGRVVKSHISAPVDEVDVHHYFEFDTRSEAVSTTPSRTIAEAS